jgi:hypothetical protein
MRSPRYLNGGTLSPFPAEAGQEDLDEMRKKEAKKREKRKAKQHPAS